MVNKYSGKKAGELGDGFLFLNPGPLPTLLTFKQSQHLLRDHASEADSRHTHPTRSPGAAVQPTVYPFLGLLAQGNKWYG